MQWWIQNFPGMGAPTPKVGVKSYYLVNFFPENCMKTKEIGPQGRISGTPFGSLIILPPATKLRQGNVFTPACHSVHRGGHVWLGVHTWWGVCVAGRGVCMAGGMHGRGACMAGGVHGSRVCMVGVCISAGMCGGQAWQGAWVAGETPTATGSTHPTGMHSC